MVHGSWLKAHGSCINARGSRLMSHEPWATSLEASGMSLEPWAMFQDSNVPRFQDSKLQRFPKCVERTFSNIFDIWVSVISKNSMFQKWVGMFSCISYSNLGYPKSSIRVFEGSKTWKSSRSKYLGLQSVKIGFDWCSMEQNNAIFPVKITQQTQPI